jgi:hypothetical protein
MIDKEEFLETVFAELNDDEHVCLARALPRSDDPSKTWFKSYLESSRSFRKWNPDKQAQSVYYCVSTVTGKLNDKDTMVSRKRKDLVRFHIIVLDDIMDKTAAPPVEPSYKMETSPGSFQYGYLLDPESTFEKYEAVVQAVHELGFGDPGAGGSFRLVRIVGSANLKPGKDEFRSHITEWSPDNVWTLKSFATDFDLDIDALPVKSVKASTTTAPGMNIDTIDPLLTWLHEQSHVVNDNDSDFVTVRCPWHENHTTGEDTASYSPLGRGGKYEKNRNFNCFHEHCKDRGTKEFLDWAQERGGPEVDRYDPLPVVQANNVIIERGPQVLDLRERLAGREPLRDLTEFSTANYFKVSVPWRDERVLVKTAFLEDFNTVHCKALTYVPSAEDIPLITAPDGALLANMYMPPQWQETTTEPTIFTEHVDYLLPDQIEHEYFMGWLAHKIQNPSERGVGIVMIAEDAYGVGRSWLGSLLDKVLPGEVRRTDIKQLAGGNGGGASTYNDIYANKQIVVIDETQADDVKVQYTAYENLKLVVDTSPTKLRANPKYGKVYDTELLFNLLAFSNNLDALHIPAGDRRFCVLSNPTTPRDDAYYTQLYEALENPHFLAAVYWYLRRYDWSAINPRKPIKTKVREAMIEVTKSPREQIVEAMHDDDTLPDFMTRAQLKAKVYSASVSVALKQQSREATIAHIEKRLWVLMQDAPWKADDDDKRFRPRIDGKTTHVKAWNPDADWPHKDADWEKIVSRNVGSLSQMAVPKPERDDE